MIINDEKIKDLNKLLEEIDIDAKDRDGKYKRMEKLRLQIRKLSLDANSVQRSGDEKRIGEFNRLYVQSLAELSRLTQTTGQTKRDDVVETVRRIKAQN